MARERSDTRDALRRHFEVDAEHARLEGEGDQSLAHWRAVHEDFFTEHAAHDHGFASDMPIVCQRFEVLHSRQRPAG